jgi:hypothetical protein
MALHPHQAAPEAPAEQAAPEELQASPAEREVLAVQAVTAPQVDKSHCTAAPTPSSAQAVWRSQTAVTAEMAEAVEAQAVEFLQVRQVSEA